MQTGGLSGTRPLGPGAAPGRVDRHHDLAVQHAAGLGRTALREAFDSLLWAARKKELKLREIEESAERIQKKGFSYPVGTSSNVFSKY